MNASPPKSAEDLLGGIYVLSINHFYYFCLYFFFHLNLYAFIICVGHEAYRIFHVSSIHVSYETSVCFYSPPNILR